ncbi:MAG: MoxR family ATPase, partial [Jatrophihabitantaceae bacterium]
VVRLVIATREPAEFGMPDVAGWVSYGASPRASLGLIAAGRALALLRGRDYVLPQDVLDVAIDVLPHRMVLSYDAIADGVTAAQAVGRVLQSVALPQVAPRQRATSGYLPPAGAAAPQAQVGPPGGFGPQHGQPQVSYPNGAHAAQQQPPNQQPSGQPSSGSWSPQA